MSGEFTEAHINKLTSELEAAKADVARLEFLRNGGSAVYRMHYPDWCDLMNLKGDEFNAFIDDILAIKGVQG
jgi:hypothetical protein